MSLNKNDGAVIICKLTREHLSLHYSLSQINTLVLSISQNLKSILVVLLGSGGCEIPDDTSILKFFLVVNSLENYLHAHCVAGPVLDAGIAAVSPAARS